MCLLQNWSNFEKCQPFLQFLSKLSDFFWGGKIWQIKFIFHKLKDFESILFLLGCDVWKINDLFQRPLWPISIILNFSKIFVVKADIKQLASKKIEKFQWKLKEYKQYLHPMGGFQSLFLYHTKGNNIKSLIKKRFTSYKSAVVLTWVNLSYNLNG